MLTITSVDLLVAQGPIVLIGRSVDMLIFMITTMSRMMIMIIFMSTVGSTDIALSRSPLPP